jgi:hypothetical protein
MPPEIQVLIDNPALLIAVLFVGSFAGMQVERFLSQQRRAAWKRKNEWRWKKNDESKAGPWAPKPVLVPEKVPDAADQLRTVMKADFRAQPLLNKSEARLFRAMDKRVIELAPPGWQVMAGQPRRNPAERGQGRLRLHQRQAR